MAYYQEETRMEYKAQGYGSPASGKYGNYNDQSSYGTGGFSTAGAYGCDNGGGGQAQLQKMQTQCAAPTMVTQYNSSSGGNFGAGGAMGAGRPGGAGFAGGAGSGGLSGDPFCALVPSSFPPGTDPKMIECYNRIDRDGSGLICDVELQTALSSFNHRFCMRTVHLLMYMFTGSNVKSIGPKEFVPLLQSLQSWKAVFQRFDRDRNGKMDGMELKEALRGLGFTLPPFAAQLLVSKFSKPGSKCFVEYDYFIECCLVVKGLTGKFKCKEDSYSGTASFTYDEFLLSVLPFIVA